MLKFKGKRLRDKEHNMVIFSVDGGETWANLPFYLDEVNHSPTGLEWGYRGSGPAQLAYAMMRTYFRVVHKDDSEDAARQLYQRFKDDVVAGFDEEWEIWEQTLNQWYDQYKIYM